MTEPNASPASFEDMLASLAGQAIQTQRALDAAWLSRCRDFQQFAAASAIAAPFAPRRLVLRTQDIECQFTAKTSSLTEIRLLNQTFRQRYKARTVTQSVHLEIRSTTAESAKTSASERREDG